MSGHMRVFVGLAVSLFVLSDTCRGEAAMTVREKTVVGHELRLVVETSATAQPLWSHSSRTTDVKGYLILVDLASKLPMTQRSKVYGPLWDVPQPRSTISFTAGANFTREDADAALATPHCAFDEKGELVRFRTDIAHKKILFDRLDLATASYKDSVAFAPIDDRTPPMSEDQVISPSGRYMLLYQDKVARLYDLYSGEEKADPWLTDRFSESRRIPNFQNVETLLTDDLDHLLVSPRAIWNEGAGIPLHETFTFGGKTLSRAEYFLCADRPEPSLGLVHRKVDEREFLREAPDSAFIIDHQLMMMHTTKDAIRLFRRDGTVVYHSEAKVAAGWHNGTLGTRHLVSDGKLVFFTVDLEHMNLDQVMDRHVALTIWDYRRDIVTSEVVPVVDLFRRESGHYLPTVKPEPVKQG
jgi:hypothetical protein